MFVAIRGFLFIGVLVALFIETNAYAGNIHEVVKKGKVKLVRRLLEEEPARTNELDDHGRTPLFYASTEEIRVLLREKDPLYLEAVRKFDESEKLRSVFREPSAAYIPTVNRGKEVDLLRQVLDSLVRVPDLELNRLKLLLLYRTFSRLLQSEWTTSACMLCFKIVNENSLKIAGSHYVTKSILEFFKSDFLVPGINKLQKPKDLTLPLMCASSKTIEGCEQRLNRLGEQNFSKQFVPFIEEVINSQRQNRSAAQSFSFQYDIFFGLSCIFVKFIERRYMDRRSFLEF